MAAALATAAVAATSENTITKSEVRGKSPARTHAQLRDVVWDMFEVQDYRSDEMPTRPLNSLHLRTKTHATHIANLCRYDLAWVDFDRRDPRDSGADAPVVAVGLQSQSYWTFLGPPPRTDEGGWQDAPVSVEECASLPEDHAAFSAPNQLEAVEGFQAWVMLREAIERGESFPLECIGMLGDTKSCTELITAGPLHGLTDAMRCTADDSGGCYQLTFDARRVIVDFDSPISGSNPQIVDVEFQSLIVFRERPID